MLVKLSVVAGTVIAALVVFALVSTGEERGRVARPVDVEVVDESGRETGYSGYCYADALVLFAGDTVDSVKEVRGDVVRPGEHVERVSSDDSQGTVYRDGEGVLHEGCSPDSQDSFAAE